MIILVYGRARIRYLKNCFYNYSSVFLAGYFLITKAAVASSIITLSGGGTVLPNTSLNLALNGLVPSVAYSVVCYVETSFPFQYILFGTSFMSNTSTILSYSLNGNYGMQNQLLAGHNIAVIEGQFTNPVTDLIKFTNLDQNYSFIVNNCFAVPSAVL